MIEAISDYDIMGASNAKFQSGIVKTLPITNLYTYNFKSTETAKLVGNAIQLNGNFKFVIVNFQIAFREATNANMSVGYEILKNNENRLTRGSITLANNASMPSFTNICQIYGNTEMLISTTVTYKHSSDDNSVLSLYNNNTRLKLMLFK